MASIEPVQQSEIRKKATPVNSPKGTHKGALEDPQKHAVMEIITEFIESADIDGAIADIEKRVSIEGIEFVKRALIFGIERKAYERELISQLLSAVYNIFQINETSVGFQLLLDRLPDMILDVPDATEVLGKFLARAVFDEILPPIFLEEAKVNNDYALRALALATAKTNEPEERKRLEHIWGPGDLSSVTRLREEVSAMLKKYLENENLNEAVQAVRDLNAPSFNSQVLKDILIASLETNSEAHQRALHNLLKRFYEISLVSSWDIRHSFDLIWRRVSDIKLDVPIAEERLTKLTQQAKEWKLLAEDFVGSEQQRA